MSEIQQKIQAELQRAEEARAKNNEGQARVCARRAAGIAIRDYLTRKGGPPPPSLSAMDLLNQLKDDPLLPFNLKLIVDHLTLRVTEEFKLPVDVDLIAEARILCDEIIKQ